MWLKKDIKFSKFVNELGNWEIIDKHHFSPQTSFFFTDKILNCKIIKCFDIENIDYDYIEKLYNKKIPKQLINFKGKHARYNVKQDVNINKYVYDLNMDDYYNFQLETKYFYNKELKQKVFNFYKNDFLFFSKLGLDYELSL